MSRTSPIRVLLLENIHPIATGLLATRGFQVETMSGALSEDSLIERLADVDVLGIRSKTHVTARVLESARHLLAVGCFCIGTNQVDAKAATRRGIPVFNAPFSNTRSVAELMIGEIIALARRLGDRSGELHAGRWRKVATGSFEIRGKTLGIVGYGHIGSQVGVLAESMGMRVVFHDIATKLPMGNNRPVDSLETLLSISDFVTLHVPATPQTHRMIDARALTHLRRGAYLLNASRGTVVDIEALAAALRAGQVGGAAIDVYPEEPEANTDSFVTALQGCPNVILTPHIGGSTEEAQEAIGREVATTLSRFVEQGATAGAVNFPVLDPPPAGGRFRIVNVHRNVPGVLRDLNRLVSDRGANIEAQYLATDPDIGYLVMDLAAMPGVTDQLPHDIDALPTSLRTRVAS